ncbi:hypothetical protein A9168_01945 [Macellibacteroides sp. HH-ZS]|nr:hypothetical protein A9168_01945 [Macellibacteroides sp. HH-ZS]
MKLAAVVITYYPDIEDTKNNIRQYIEYIDKLIVWENTPEKDRSLFDLDLSEYSNKIIFLGTKKNEGIAYALNKSSEWALTNGFTHLLTMDQDSYWLNFKLYKDYICNNFIENVSTYCPNVNNIYPKLDSYIELNECITSGSIYNLKYISEIGFFREDYFIDAVDLEYCYKGISKGYKTMLVPIGELKQKFGDVTLIKKWTTNNYSAIRNYYIVRNHIILWKEYPKLFNKKSFLFTRVIKTPVKIILGEKSKLEKCSAIIKGLISGLIYKRKL